MIAADLLCVDLRAAARAARSKVIERGRVVQEGRFEDLADQPGLFAAGEPAEGVAWTRWKKVYGWLDFFAEEQAEQATSSIARRVPKAAPPY